MTLPISWKVLPGPFNRYQLLSADVIHNNVRIAKQMAMPASYSKATWWLCVAAMQAEIKNAVGGADALLPGIPIKDAVGGVK